MLDRIVKREIVDGARRLWIFPRQCRGRRRGVFADASRHSPLATFHFLRQQIEKPDGQPQLCLADFVAPREAGQDYIGAFAVTAGLGVDELAAQFKAGHDDYNAIMTEALADRLAEAFAEYLHRRVRAEWGYGRNENLTVGAID